MPLPFLLGAIGVAAGVVGVGGHLSAQETNEEAKKISHDAQKIYDAAKESLEKKQEKSQAALLELGYSKKNTLDNSMKQFLKAYERIKNISVKDSKGLDEISNFTIEQKDAIHLREMTDLYSSAIGSSVAGAATGAVVALAASGSLSIVAGSLSVAGTALSVGMVGTAASIAGSTVLTTLTATPLAAIAAPVLLFTGFSASSKADENLEKAQTMMAEAKKAVEQMKISETLCEAIEKRAQMYQKQLGELEIMYTASVQRLEKLVQKKDRRGRKSTYTSGDFSNKEIEIIAVTRSLAGAVKAIIDTPILTNEGQITDDSLKIYDNTAEKLPTFKTLIERSSSFCDEEDFVRVCVIERYKDTEKGKILEPGIIFETSVERANQLINAKVAKRIEDFVKVCVIERYKDTEKGKILEPGIVFETSAERANQLINAKVVKRVDEKCV